MLSLQGGAAESRCWDVGECAVSLHQQRVAGPMISTSWKQAVVALKHRKELCGNIKAKCMLFILVRLSRAAPTHAYPSLLWKAVMSKWEAANKLNKNSVLKHLLQNAILDSLYSEDGGISFLRNRDTVLRTSVMLYSRRLWKKLFCFSNTTSLSQKIPWKTTFKSFIITSLPTSKKYWTNKCYKM
jgi:hypothetical protein